METQLENKFLELFPSYDINEKIPKKKEKTWRSKND